MTGERGLAGAFNSNVLRKAHEFFRSHPGKKITTIPVGKKGRDSLRRAGFTFAAEYVNVLARVDFKTAREIAKLVAELYTQGRNRLGLHHLQRIQERDGSDACGGKTLAGRSRFATKKTKLPPTRCGARKTARNETPVDYIYEQPAEQILASCCRATSKCRFSAPCWNLPRPSTPRA